MADLLFRCPHCTKSLAAGETAAGTTFSCPACGRDVEAPAPATFFSCPECTALLYAPAELREDSFECPNCETEVEVPRHAKYSCPSCRVHIEVDDATLPIVAGRVVDCPHCGKEVTMPRLPHPPVRKPAKKVFLRTGRFPPVGAPSPSPASLARAVRVESPEGSQLVRIPSARARIAPSAPATPAAPPATAAAAPARRMKRCPFCAEEILDEAIKCRFCGSMLRA